MVLKISMFLTQNVKLIYRHKNHFIKKNLIHNSFVIKKIKNMIKLLSFMNSCLSLYKNNKNVWKIYLIV